MVTCMFLQSDLNCIWNHKLPLDFPWKPESISLRLSDLTALFAFDPTRISLINPSVSL
jgi:hypothetical protein